MAECASPCVARQNVDLEPESTTMKSQTMPNHAMLSKYFHKPEPQPYVTQQNVDPGFLITQESQTVPNHTNHVAVSKWIQNTDA